MESNVTSICVCINSVCERICYECYTALTRIVYWQPCESVTLVGSAYITRIEPNPIDGFQKLKKKNMAFCSIDT